MFYKKIISLIFILSNLPFAYSSYVVNIDNPRFRKLNVALLDFEFEPSNDHRIQKIAFRGRELFSQLLNYTGLINTVNKNLYSSKGSSVINKKYTLDEFKEIDFLLWRKLAIDSVIKVKMFPYKKRVKVEIRAADINRISRILGKAYTIDNVDDFYEISKRYIDHLLMTYTGKSGIFSSSIVLSGRETKNASKQIFVSDVFGKTTRKITKGNSLSILPAWSPDTQKVVYTSFAKGAPSLVLLDIVTLKEKELTNFKGLYSGGAFYPSRNFIVYTGTKGSQADLFSMNMEKKSKHEMLTYDNSIVVDPAFSPDGKWILYVSSRYGNPHIFKAEVKWARDFEKFTLENHTRLTYRGWYNTMPSWSPDGKKIAFAGYDKERGHFDIFTMDSKGNYLQRLTSNMGDNEAPTWSPNGRLIMFQSNRPIKNQEKNRFRIYIMNNNGSEQRLVDFGLYEAMTPKWSNFLPL